MRQVVLVLVMSLASCGGDQGPEPMGPDPATIGKANLGAAVAPASTVSTAPNTAPANPPSSTTDPKTPPTPTTNSKTAELTEAGADKLLGRFVMLLKTASNNVQAAKGNCPLIAKRLNAWVDTNAAEAARIYAQLGAAQKYTNVMKKHGPELASTQAVFGKATAPCAKDPAVEKAAQRFILSLQGKAK